MISKSYAQRKLRYVSNTLVSVMKRRFPGDFIGLDRPEVQRAQYTNGWTIELGWLMRGDMFNVTAFLDDMAAKKPCLWIGAFFESSKTASIALHRLERQEWKPIVIRQSAYKWIANRNRMRVPLSNSEFGRPIVELYRSGQKGIGMYFKGGLRESAQIVKSNILLAATLLAEMADAFQSTRRMVTIDAGLRHRPNRNAIKVVERFISVRAFIRNTTQRRDALERDTYRCQVCGLQPSKIYGINGRACLEVHHIEALRTRKKSAYTLDDLVTVCANCHRILGRLGQDRRGLTELRNRFLRSST